MYCATPGTAELQCKRAPVRSPRAQQRWTSFSDALVWVAEHGQSDPGASAFPHTHTAFCAPSTCIQYVCISAAVTHKLVCVCLYCYVGALSLMSCVGHVRE
ncbi:hypothetical protein GOODEAATRI_006848 [Goodea atripinnis]|uniref:Uncharacterized protein n=1 Tax=Goodea atripinnis TaxID=208336 RepID=A0ABV0PVX3_9TELE